MSSVSNYKEAHRRDELEFILLAVDAFHECVRPPAASGERGRAFLQSNLVATPARAPMGPGASRDKSRPSFLAR